MLKISILKQLSLIIFASVFFLTACGDDDECMLVCGEGEVLTAECTCVEINPGDDSIIRVEANITKNTTWAADKTYVLGGRITVTAGNTLTIDPGTVIKGEAGAAANATALLIARGAKINACGTAELPIIFTSVADEITNEDITAGLYSSPNLQPTVNGLWGGLIILGNAPISAQNDNDMDVTELQIEGIPTSDSNGLYGGNQADDNSGSLCYISIRHGGTNIGEGNEINGLTLGGVGSGTSINNIEVVANQDDGIEWFGGTCSATNILIWNCGDDGLDTDQAWNGTCDNWIVAVPQGGSAMELDGPEGVLTQGCNSFTNGTIYAGASIDHLIDWDDNTNTGITNLYIYGVDANYDASVGIESFGGDGACNSGTWEYTVPESYDAATLLLDAIGAGEATQVGINLNTVGADASIFNWTWGRASGTLDNVGL